MLLLVVLSLRLVLLSLLLALLLSLVLALLLLLVGLLPLLLLLLLVLLPFDSKKPRETIVATAIVGVVAIRLEEASRHNCGQVGEFICI